METSVNQLDNIIQEIKNLWSPRFRISPFWKSLSESYYISDNNEIGRNVYYSEISFYPLLIQTLSRHIPDNFKIEITFLSTLLPRHYWNFPVAKNYHDSIYFFSFKKSFLDKYRNSIKIKDKDSNNITLKRILIVGDKPFQYRGTHLFGYRELIKDKKAYFNKEEGPKQIKWKNFFESNYENQKLYEKINLGYSTGCSYRHYIEILTEMKMPNSVLDNRLKDFFTEGEFYTFQKKANNDKFISVLDYYIHELHSSDEGAKITVLSNKKSDYSLKQIKLFGKKIPILPISELNIYGDFKLDLGFINISDKEGHDGEGKTIILNTYMDLINNIVKLEVIDENHVKFQQIKETIKTIEKNAKSLTLKAQNNIASPSVEKFNPIPNGK